MQFIRKDLKDNREEKLTYDYKVIESVTETFIADFKIDSEVENWLREKLSGKLSMKEIQTNLTSGKRNYKKQFGKELFLEFTVVVNEIYNRNMDRAIKESSRTSSDLETKRLAAIFDNILEPIPLTMFEEGVHRLTLVSYHYFLKVVNSISEDFMAANDLKNINGVKNPTELFSEEMYEIISEVEELTKFTLTLKSLIDMWLMKYNNKTKIGEFYYDILMITPEYIVEKILKYFMFTAIRNKNPFTLRAIFSSYITLIHKNLSSFYATNLTKIKVGYFKQLEGLFTDNFDLIFDQGTQADPKKFIINTLIFSHIMKNKKYIKHNFHFMDDEYMQNLFDLNYFDVFGCYNADNGISFMDHFYFYGTSLKFTKNSINKESTYHKISGNFFRKTNIKKTRMLLHELMTKHFWKFYYEQFKDEETVTQIIEAIVRDLMQKINVDQYLDANFSPLNMTYDEYLLFLEKFIILMKKTIVPIPASTPVQGNKI